MESIKNVLSCVEFDMLFQDKPTLRTHIVSKQSKDKTKCSECDIDTDSQQRFEVLRGNRNEIAKGNLVEQIFSKFCTLNSSGF